MTEDIKERDILKAIRDRDLESFLNSKEDIDE